MTDKKFKGYLDRLRENVDALDEAIANARAMSKKKGKDANALQNVTIAVHYDDGSMKNIQTDLLVFTDMRVIDNLLGMDLIQKIGTLVVTSAAAWFEDA